MIGTSESVRAFDPAEVQAGRDTPLWPPVPFAHGIAWVRASPGRLLVQDFAGVLWTIDPATGATTSLARPYGTGGWTARPYGTDDERPPHPPCESTP